jgi:hypothetical protein
MTPFLLPQRLHNATGQVRRLGIELEFAGLELEQIAELIIRLYGGRHERISRFEHRVAGTRWGDFTIEIDLRLLKDRAYLKLLERLGVHVEPDTLRHAEDVLARLAATLIPHEIAAPPIPMTEAHEIERLRESLQRHHALGTRAALRYAFGLQFNPEAPALDAPTLLAYLQAFLLLADWLYKTGQVAIARRLSPFINDFPERYARGVLDPGYRPTLPVLIDDYLRDNPTRNRPLDMLPIFAELDPKRVRRGIDDPGVKINPRPTFHYRLPNSLVDDPDWTIAREWRGWLAVEALAAQPDTLRHLSAAYLADHRQMVIGYDEAWAERIEREWL